MSHTITFDNTDPVFRYSNDWTLDGTYNATHAGTSGTLASAKSVTASVTFKFPQPATYFSYWGIPRCCGGWYEICIDCDPANPQYTPIEGVYRTDDGKFPPKILFERTFREDPAVVHEVLLRNTADGRFGGNSQITVDRFELRVLGVVTTTNTNTNTKQENSETRSSTGTSSPSPSSESSSSLSSSSSSSSSSPSSPSPSSSSSPSPFSPSSSSSSSSSPSSSSSDINGTALPFKNTAKPIAPAVGGALGGVALLILLIGLALYLRRRYRQRQQRFSETSWLQPPPPPSATFTPSSDSAPPFPVSTTTITGTPIPTSPVLVPVSPPANASTSHSQSQSGWQRGRGSGRGGSSMDNLPPQYDQVFNNRRQSRRAEAEGGAGR